MTAVVVLPTYNERENIAEILRAVREAAPDAHLLVVDDASPDGTGRIAQEVGTQLGRVEVVHRAGVRGLGGSYRDGFAVAFDRGFDVVVSMDSDFSHDPATIPTLLTAIADGADAVVGSRYVPGGATVDWPWRRRMLSRWGNRYTAFVLGLPVHDCTSGFRAYRTGALQAIEPTTTTAEGYAFLTELLYRLRAGGYAIEETPIVFRDRVRGTSKMSGRIILESMLLVTRWGVRDRLSAVASAVRASRARY